MLKLKCQKLEFDSESRLREDSRCQPSSASTAAEPLAPPPNSHLLPASQSFLHSSVLWGISADGKASPQPQVAPLWS